MTTLHDFTPWLEHIRDRNIEGLQQTRQLTANRIQLLLDSGWQLFNPVEHLEDGHDLIFRKGGARIELFIRGEFNLMGAKPGVRLSDPTESWEATFSVRTPLPVIKEAIDWLVQPEF